MARRLAPQVRRLHELICLPQTALSKDDRQATIPTQFAAPRLRTILVFMRRALRRRPTVASTDPRASLMCCGPLFRRAFRDALLLWARGRGSGRKGGRENETGSAGLELLQSPTPSPHPDEARAFGQRCLRGPPAADRAVVANAVRADGSSSASPAAINRLAARATDELLAYGRRLRLHER